MTQPLQNHNCLRPFCVVCQVRAEFGRTAVSGFVTPKEDMIPVAMSDERLEQLEQMVRKQSIHSSQLPPPKPRNFDLYSYFDLYKGLQEACCEIRRLRSGRK